MGKKAGFNGFGNNRVNKGLYEKNQKPFVQKPKLIDYTKLKDFEFERTRGRIEMVLGNEELLRVLKESSEAQEPRIAMVGTIAHHRLDDLIDIPRDDNPRIIVVGAGTYHESLLMRFVLEDVKRLLERSKK